MELIIKIFVKFMGVFCFHNHHIMKSDERVFFYENDLSGCLILSRVDYCLSNLAIKGKYKHAGTIDGNFVIEAKTKTGVVSTPIEKFLEDKDQYVVLSVKNISDEVSMNIVFSARRKIGIEYDMLFEENDDKFYCSESVYDSIVESVDGFNIEHDGKVITPQNLYNKDKFYILKEVTKR